MLPRAGWLDGTTAYEGIRFKLRIPPGRAVILGDVSTSEGAGRSSNMSASLKEGTPEGVKGNHCVRESGATKAAIRAGYKRAVQGRSSVEGDEVWVNPFYWQTAADFEMYRQEFGLPRNPSKDVVGISGECLCGANARAEDERAAIRAIEPETNPRATSKV